MKNSELLTTKRQRSSITSRDSAAISNERSETTLVMLAECFEELGGAPKVVLADRMGCLKGGVVANKVVPTAEYVRFATHVLVPAGSAARPLIRSRRGSWRTWSVMPSGT